MVMVILGKSCCSICKIVLNKSDEIVGLPHIFGENSKYYKYSDSAMHVECFENWEHKGEFHKKFFEMEIEAEKFDRYWAKVFLNDDVFISVNPNALMSEVRILLKTTGIDIRVKLGDWEAKKNNEANLKAQMLNNKLRNKGLKSPHCNKIIKNIRFVEKDPTKKSFFICQECSRSFIDEKVPAQ